MPRFPWKNGKKIAIGLLVLLLFLTIKLQTHEHKTSMFLPRVKPTEVWEYVADFSNMKHLNPTIIDFTITDESGNYDHWKYSTEYTEYLSHWPYLKNHAVAHFNVKTIPGKHIHVIESVHKTCFMKNMFCGSRKLRNCAVIVEKPSIHGEIQNITPLTLTFVNLSLETSELEVIDLKRWGVQQSHLVRYHHIPMSELRLYTNKKRNGREISNSQDRKTRAPHLLHSASEFKFSPVNSSKGTLCEETVVYQCPVLLSIFCKREVVFQRNAIMYNLKDKFK